MARTREAEAGGGGSCQTGLAGSQPSPPRPETRPRPPHTGAKPVVSYLGPVASYSHQAVLGTFPQERWELRPATTITDVFDSVQDGEAPVGVVPFENSSHGCVVVTLDNFADRDGRYGDLVVQGEIYVDVKHCLLGRKAPADDGAAPAEPHGSLRHITQLYSHPQALGQCRRFIAAHLRGAETHDVSSTSRAAELVARAGAGASSAAISSRLAATVYGLDVLAEAVQDRADNTTRFLIIRNARRPVQHPPAAMQPAAAAAGGPPGDKTLVSFTVPHGSPGALADVLCCFNECGLNLTSINSRPSLLAPFQYVFFVEFEGHRYDGDGRVEGALQKMGRVASGWRWLGSWQRCR